MRRVSGEVLVWRRRDEDIYCRFYKFGVQFMAENQRIVMLHPLRFDCCMIISLRIVRIWRFADIAVFSWHRWRMKTPGSKS